jgi:hypothetical protein
MSVNDELLRLFQSYINESAKKIVKKELATLWAGMGKIYKVEGSLGDNVMIVKRICFPTGTALSIGDARKAASYDVEAKFYECFSAELIDMAKYAIVPRCFGVDLSLRSSGLVSICMQELPGPVLSGLSMKETEAAIRAIAALHSKWYGIELAASAVTGGLQPQGGYWYLDTRPDEFQDIPKRGWEGRLRKAAAAIDERLKADRWQCVIHGDLKGCNMASFMDKDASPASVDGDGGNVRISFCDFQYCGKSCGMKDIAYFFSVTADSHIDRLETELLTLYHHELCEFLIAANADNVTIFELPSMDELSASLDLAYADLCRWMAGWGYWGNVSFLQGRVQRVLHRLDGGAELASPDAYRQAVFREYPLALPEV